MPDKSESALNTTKKHPSTRSLTGADMVSYFDRAVERFLPVRGLKRKQARMMLSAYKAADTSRLRNDWSVLGAQRDATPHSWELSVIRDRSRDAIRNDPVASGATDTLKLNIVGSGLKPQARIRADRLGVSEDRATELNRQAEAIWKQWTPLADSANRLDFDEIQFMAIGKIIEDGESLLIPTWANEKWRPLGRCIEMIESDRLESPTKEKGVEHGIKVGSRGQPKTYYIRKANTLHEHTPINARDSEGRPKILHIFPSKRPEQMRGVPFFAPVLSYFYDIAGFLESTLMTARVAACLGVFITQENPMGGAIMTGGDTEATTNKRIQGVEPAMVNYLNVNEKINVVEPNQPGETFSAFMETMLRITGSAIGLPYELLVKDFSKTNYSSARAALLEGRRMFTQWRGWLSKKLCQPMWELVLEEAFLRGMFTAPDFYENKTELCRAVWIGGAWGWVDPVKEVEASMKAIEYNLSTHAKEAAAQGEDWEEILEQRKREKATKKKLGLEEPEPPQGVTAPQKSNARWEAMVMAETD